MVAGRLTLLEQPASAQVVPECAAQGTGIVAIDGGDDQIVSSGEVVLLPGGVPHMHGATDEGSAMHLSIMRETDADFDCPIRGVFCAGREALRRGRTTIPPRSLPRRS